MVSSKGDRGKRKAIHSPSKGEASKKNKSKGKDKRDSRVERGCQNDASRYLLPHEGDMDNFSIVSSKELVSSKFIDLEALRALPFGERVEEWLEHLNFLPILTNHVPTYSDVAIQFFSTLRVTNLERDYAAGYVQFVAMGKVFEMSVEEFGGRFGFSSGDHLKMKRHTEYNPRNFWKKTSGDYTFKGGRTSPVDIKDKAVRCLHTILVHTLLAKEDIYRISATELYFMWAMIEKHPINVASYVLGHWTKVQGASYHVIRLGGYLTDVLSKLPGIDFNPRGPVLGGDILCLGKEGTLSVRREEIEEDEEQEEPQGVVRTEIEELREEMASLKEQNEEVLGILRRMDKRVGVVNKRVEIIERQGCENHFLLHWLFKSGVKTLGYLKGLFRKGNDKEEEVRVNQEMNQIMEGIASPSASVFNVNHRFPSSEGYYPWPQDIEGTLIAPGEQFMPTTEFEPRREPPSMKTYSRVKGKTQKEVEDPPPLG